ncbi:Matrixin [Actinobacteria bacterium IMCC26207]|nr:Matrixin [Actinobacteria bacterium IMCC26207]
MGEDDLSSEQLRRDIERAARSRNLQTRLAAEDAQKSQIKGQQKRRIKTLNRKTQLQKYLGPILAVGLVAVVVWMNYSNNGSMVASPQRPENYPPQDSAVSQEPLGVPPAAPNPSGPYEFLMKQPDGGGPVAWDPCRPVRYVVNSTGEPAGASALVAEAISRTAAATGLQFEDAGSSDELWTKDRAPYQPDRYGDRWAPALISWSTASAVPDLAGYIAGFGGGIPRSDLKTGELVYVSGGLVLDLEDLGTHLAEPGGTQAVTALIQHELGHMVGLGHVNDPAQLMYSQRSPSSPINWGAGDLAGLHALGNGTCLPEL